MLVVRVIIFSYKEMPKPNLSIFGRFRDHIASFKVAPVVNLKLTFTDLIFS